MSRPTLNKLLRKVRRLKDKGYITNDIYLRYYCNIRCRREVNWFCLLPDDCIVKRLDGEEDLEW